MCSDLTVCGTAGNCQLQIWRLEKTRERKKRRERERERERVSDRQKQTNTGKQKQKERRREICSRNVWRVNVAEHPNSHFNLT